MNTTKTRKFGILTTTPRFSTAATAREVIDLYNGGVSIGAIANEFGASVGAVRRLLVINGVKIKGPGRYASTKA